MNLFSLKTKSPQTKNRIVIAMAVFCTILVVVVWLFVLSITKPKEQTLSPKPFQEIKNQISEVVNQGKLEKISETESELKNTLQQIPQASNTPGQAPLSSTP